MTKIYKFNADVIPSLYILLFFMAQLAACYYISNDFILILIAVVTLTFPGLTSASYNHHQQHHNIFKQPALNRLFELVLALQSGVSSYAWVLHHNLGHHPHYFNQHSESEQSNTVYPLDESRWTFKNGKVMNFFQYGFIGFLLAFFRAHKVGFKYKKIYIKYMIFRAIYYFTIIAGFYFFGMSFFIIFIMPSIIVLFLTISSTYSHHAGLRSDNHYSASNNNTNKIYNFFTCNLGYHTAHHLRPGLHWSLLPAFHANIQDKIPNELIKNNPPRALRLIHRLLQVIISKN